MKNIKFAVVATALSTLSFGVFIAEPAPSTQAQNTNKIGVVSAGGAITLDGLEARPAEKANAAGATGYSIISAIGKDKMSGTAAIYE